MAKATKMINGAVEKIIPGCKWVVEHAEHVKINYDKIPEYTDFILKRYQEDFALDIFSEDIHYLSDNLEYNLAYILVLDSINFGSGYFKIAQDKGVELNYHVVAKSLKRLFEKGEFNSAEQWLDTNADCLSQAFSVPLGLDLRLDELLSLFAASLRDVGKHITLEYQGSVKNLLAAAEGSAVKLADILAVWDSFKDVWGYKGKEVFILKRAQILAADIDLVHKSFSDIERLTIFADNMVPYVLQGDGVLKYETGLAKRIDSGDLISSGSNEEIEMRAAAIYAVELMKKHAVEQGKQITAVDIDRFLWHRGEEDKESFKSSHLYHRTLTAAY